MQMVHVVDIACRCYTVYSIVGYLGDKTGIWLNAKLRRWVEK